jgi:hypothetical protein
VTGLAAESRGAHEKLGELTNFWFDDRYQTSP